MWFYCRFFLTFGPLKNSGGLALSDFDFAHLSIYAIALLVTPSFLECPVMIKTYNFHHRCLSRKPQALNCWVCESLGGLVMECSDRRRRVPARLDGGVRAPPDGPAGSPRWRGGSPGCARHRHRLTTIKTKSAAVGSHEYWMGGRARTGTLLSATQTTTTLDTRYRKYLTRGVGNKWHSNKKSWRKVLEILKRTLFGLKTIQTFMRSISLMGCFLLLICGHQFDLLSPTRATLVLKVLETELLDLLSLSQKSQNI